MSVRQFVESAIASNRVVVFSKSYCPYCTSTKRTLAAQNLDFKLFELDQMENGAEIQNFLKTMTGQSTVPNTFITQKHIGGNSDLDKIIKAGNLQSYL